ncbi:lysostaphin resistance A-like protein [Micromonospora sp. DT81.3]|uniref:CPBP family intramembrane glutamic endopeptidase n=1 Tax=Micromonospora sp. DT81.3 TaxID=3416523 RepID=UPI003CF168B1
MSAPTGLEPSHPGIEERPPERQVHQLSLPGIIGVWAAAAMPMALLAWVVAPWAASGSGSPLALTQALILFLTAGLAWQFILVLALVFREQRTLRWSVVRDVLWLRAPQNPKTGRRGGRMWWIVPIAAVAFGLEALLPFEIAPAAGRDFGEFLESVQGQAMLSGSWLWLSVIFAFLIFNTVLGEELLFRGYLLPRMQGAFGKRDWIANGVLFAVYHLHIPWTIPITLIDTFILSLPSRRYRSAWIGIIAHSAQSLVLFPLVLLFVFQQ